MCLTYSSGTRINRKNYFFMRRLLKLFLLALSLAAPLLAAAQASQTSVLQPAIRIALIESLSGSFANTGEAVFRNLVWATERVNARGGVKLLGGNRPMAIER